MASKTALVIGATSSLAQALCRVLASRSYGLVLCGRDEGELELLAADLATRFGIPVRMFSADLLDPHFHAADCIAHAGEFDCAIIAVGDMGGDNKDDPENLAYITHINYTAPAQIATTAAAHLHEAGHGSVVIISSVAGDRGRRSNYLYGSAKAALSTFASGLRNRYAKSGVHVMTVKPGFIDTPMTWGMKSPLIASREYVAEKIAVALEKKRNVIYVPFFWRFIMLIIIHIPEQIFKKLSL
jgi:decaprenylphospho-beta-D-erythro-pentofuranosid-2-ulose 2-reductase